MQHLTNFNFETHTLTASLDDDSTPWFNANEVCEILEFANPRDAIATHVDEEDVAKRDTLTAGGIQSLNYVNESGLYALIFGSRKEAAKRFKRLVTSEILPAIRKQGFYNSPEYTQLQEKTEELKQLENKSKRREEKLVELRSRNRYLESKNSMYKDERMELTVLNIISEERKLRLELENAMYSDDLGKLDGFEKKSRSLFVKRRVREAVRAVNMLKKVFKGTRFEGDFTINLCFDRIEYALDSPQNWR